MLKSLLQSVLINGLFLLSSATYAQAPERIKLGMSVALSGPASHIGMQLKGGHQLYLEYANDHVLNEKTKLDLLVLDDGYEPNRTVDNTHYLIQHHKIHALIGNMGTPTAHAIKDILKRHQLPFLMPYTGANFLYSNPQFPTFTLRPSYLEEAEEQIKYLVDELGHKKIALFIQADEFGLTLEQSHRQALRDKNIEPVVIARFRRNTNDVARALTQILLTDTTAIAMIGTYEPLAAFINQAYRAGFRGTYTSVSFVSSAALFENIIAPAQVMVTEVLPDPTSCKGHICTLYRKLSKDKKKTVSHQSFEGFVNAYLLVEALKHCETGTFSTCIVPAIEQERSTNPAIKTLFKQQKNRTEHPVYRSYLKY
ncbi:ABC transporter substrate-binding protein [Pseudoalteromonas luteoviolacea]|uniref:ABC transporter substrate-binding protein n=1 Tax=Pseudoalteromonas luteoviolacea TaxID=43657 RepID=UPI001B35E64B|nr:ABC transporter substrate-binding protein [Pseudoalteromonas luteoviolacea]MBQ4813361.1 ABC transporter substrate-binding protein [Pseudoalteromonas luteoviolacea]